MMRNGSLRRRLKGLPRLFRQLRTYVRTGSIGETLAVMQTIRVPWSESTPLESRTQFIEDWLQKGARGDP